MTGLRFLTASAAVLLSIAPALAQHQHPAAPAAGAPAQAHKMMAPDKMSPDCAAMMQMHTKMKADTQAEDTRLEGLISRMNEASGDRKVDAVATAVSEMANQRKTRDARMHEMQMSMMTHMMEHMKKGGDSMMQCPMMKGMMNHSGTPAAPATPNHQQHH